jgi:hypothetical protein
VGSSAVILLHGGTDHRFFGERQPFNGADRAA